MFTHPKSTVRVLHILMHLSAGHMTLLLGKFHPHEFFPQSELGRWADSRWALPQISSFICIHYSLTTFLLLVLVN